MCLFCNRDYKDALTVIMSSCLPCCSCLFHLLLNSPGQAEEAVWFTGVFNTNRLIELSLLLIFTLDFTDSSYCFIVVERVSLSH